jgi:hypothetical protein
MDGLTKADPKVAQPARDALTCHLGLTVHIRCRTGCPPFTVTQRLSFVIHGQMTRYTHANPNENIPATFHYEEVRNFR